MKLQLNKIASIELTLLTYIIGVKDKSSAEFTLFTNLKRENTCNCI